MDGEMPQEQTVAHCREHGRMRAPRAFDAAAGTSMPAAPSALWPSFVGAALGLAPSAIELTWRGAAGMSE
jgi:hypothetical protein